MGRPPSAWRWRTRGCAVTLGLMRSGGSQTMSPFSPAFLPVAKGESRELQRRSGTEADVPRELQRARGRSSGRQRLRSPCLAERTPAAWGSACSQPPGTAAGHGCFHHQTEPFLHHFPNLASLPGSAARTQHFSHENAKGCSSGSLTTLLGLCRSPGPARFPAEVSNLGHLKGAPRVGRELGFKTRPLETPQVRHPNCPSLGKRWPSRTNHLLGQKSVPAGERLK